MKKTFYIIAWMVLGLIMSFGAHALIEMQYLKWAESNGIVAPFYGSCALTPMAQALIIAIFLILGFWQGLVWYRKVYVEKFWKKQKWLNRFK